jgi:oligopeptidase A
MADNPLLQRAFRIPFDEITPEHVEPAVDVLLERAREGIEAIIDHEGPRTWDDTMGALEELGEGLEYAMGVVGHLESVHTSPELRAAYNAVQPKVSEFYSHIPLDAKLWTAIKAYAATEEAEALTGTRARLLKKTVDDFRRHGADLDPEDKKKLASLDVELAQLTTKFAEHVLDSTAAFELVVDDESRLAGLPESAIAAAHQNAEEKGLEGWRFTLSEPSVIPVLTYLDDAEIRRQIWTAYNRRATEGELDNRGLLVDILKLRRRKATLLGFDNFVDLVLEERMAHRAARASEFVDDLRERTAPFFEKEKAELLAFRRELEGPNAPALSPWDVGYYAEKMRRDRYDFDEEQLRPYFPVEGVLRGMFELVQRLYGIQVRTIEGFPTWDPSVRTFEIVEGDRQLGVFYADLEPRETKRGGAWMNGLITGVPKPGGREPHLGLICGNLTQPVGDKPALLTHREVETIFHEFGHLLHHMLSEVEVRSLAGTNVAWDFVELPSQIMENWCWEREALDLFARHWETGEPIPDDLFDKMQRARKFRAASGMMRQLGFASVDLALHTTYDPERDGDVLAYGREILAQFAATPLPDDYAMLCGFLHLFSHPVGYAGAYYSYKWAEVLDADAFTAFQRGGIFSREVGTAFRTKILARGDSRDPLDLYRDFMGREPELGPLLERSGLTKAA